MMSNADSAKDGYSCNYLTTSSHGSDYMIGFNDIRFSDRELIIEIFADDGGESSCSEVCSRSTKLHVNSLLLAAKSPFFHNLFTNGMMESEQRCVTLRIHASEETAVMELLNYLYSGRLSAKTAPALLDVLELADKFQVVSCMTLCTSLLLKLPMSTEFALRYLDVTCSLPMQFQRLADAAKRYLEARYRDVDRTRKEIMEMPLVGIEAILSSDVLEVASEDELFELAVTWTKAHYPEPEDQRKILSTRLARHLRFPYMSLDKLREVLDSKLLDDDFAYKVAVDALFFRSNKTHHHCRISESTSRRRTYRRRPITVLEIQLPFRNLVAYFDLTLEECVKLRPSEYLCWETFDFCGHMFELYATRFPESRSFVSFCLDASRRPHRHDPVVDLDYEFAAMSKSAQEFVSKSGNLDYFAADGIRGLILYETPWADFKSGKSLDFIHGILYLELKLTIGQ